MLNRSNEKFKQLTHLRAKASDIFEKLNRQTIIFNVPLSRFLALYQRKIVSYRSSDRISLMGGGGPGSNGVCPFDIGESKNCEYFHTGKFSKNVKKLREKV